MKINISKEEYLKHLDRIPKDLVDAYFADTTQDAIDKIAEKYSLLDTQTQRFREDTAWALIGLLHPDSLKEIFIKDLGVSMVVAAAIVGDLNHELFVPHKKSITEVLLTYPPKKEWFETPTSATPPPTLKPIAPTIPPINVMKSDFQHTTERQYSGSRTSTPNVPSTSSGNIIPPVIPAQAGIQGNVQLGEVGLPPEVRLPRPITAPPLQVARPLGSRPSILEVQRGTDDIRRAPQAPVGGYTTQENSIQKIENRIQPANTPPAPTPSVILSPQANLLPSSQTTSERSFVAPAPQDDKRNIQLGEVGLPPEVRLPTTVNQTPHVMFKYVHPEPPAVAQVPNTPPVILNPQMKNLPPSAPAVNERSFVTPAPQDDKKNELPKDAFHKTQEEHAKTLPTEHQVMDLEEYHTNIPIAQKQDDMIKKVDSTSSGNIVQSGNMLNLKE